MTDQKSSKKVLNLANLGKNWLIINKITTSQFNSLEVDSNVDYIIIKRLRFDSKLDNIPVFIKKIYIECVKFDNDFYNEQNLKKADFKVFKNGKEDELIAKCYNFFETRYQPFFQKFIKCPFNVTVKHYQECNTFEHAGRKGYFDEQMNDKTEDKVTLLRRLLSRDYEEDDQTTEYLELRQRLKIANNVRMFLFSKRIKK